MKGRAMALIPIICIPDPVLRLVAAPVICIVVLSIHGWPPFSSATARPEALR